MNLCVTTLANCFYIPPRPRIPTVPDRRLMMHQRCRRYPSCPLAPLTEWICLALGLAQLCPPAAAVYLLLCLISTLLPVIDVYLLPVFVAVATWIIGQRRAADLSAWSAGPFWHLPPHLPPLARPPVLVRVQPVECRHRLRQRARAER